MRQARQHPTEYQLRTMSNDTLAAYLEREASALGDPHGQKQTAIPRALLEVARRLRGTPPVQSLSGDGWWHAECIREMTPATLTQNNDAVR